MAETPPAFQTPPPLNLQKRAVPGYPHGPRFDFATGDFVVDGAGRVEFTDGHETWATWCVKAVLTERLTYLIYSPRYGCELAAVQQAPTPARARLIARTAISRAVQSDPRTRDATDFTFRQEGDQLFVSCTVTPKVGTTSRISVRLEA